MQFTTKIKSVGNSLAIIIPKNSVADILNLDVSDFVSIKINKISGIEGYFCVRCSYHFFMNEEYPYCPICGESDIIKLDEAKDAL